MFAQPNRQQPQTQPPGPASALPGAATAPTPGAASAQGATSVQGDTSAGTSRHAQWGQLIYLGFYFLPPLMLPTRPWHWTLLLLAFALFLWVYQRVNQPGSQTNWPALSLLALIASAITPLNSGSMAMFAYVSFFLGFWLKGTRFVLAMLILLGWQAAWLWYWHPSGWLQAYALIVCSGVSLSGLVERLRQAHQRQQARSNAELASMARQLERERIARDLHDLLGHSLASIALKAELTDLLLSRQQTEQARQQLAALQQLARHSLQQVRDTISGYRAQGLQTLLPSLLAQLRSNGWQCHVGPEIAELAADCPPAIELALTELCTNLLRHSSGRQMWLSASAQHQHWLLQLRDDGPCQQLTAGSGLDGIRQRLTALGGDFSWQLNPTCFTLRWPLAAAGHGAEP